MSDLRDQPCGARRDEETLAGGGMAASAGDDVVILDEAELAAGWFDLRAAITAAVRAGARTVVIDVTRSDRLSSSTVTALLWAQQRCQARGGAVVLRGASRRLRDLLQDTGLARFFDVLPADAETGTIGR